MYSSIIALFIPGIIVLFIYKGYLKNDIGISLIGYAGSVLGGFLTLFGVWWTINFTEETRKKDIFLQYRPFLSYRIEKYKKQYKRVGEMALLFRNVYFNDTDLYTEIQVINFKNAGKRDIASLKCKLGEIRVVASDFSSEMRKVF